MATTIDSLPLELLGEILAYLDQPRAAALVCRRWRGPAQRALFAFVTLNSDEQIGLWLDSQARPRYRTMCMQLNSYTTRVSQELMDTWSTLEELILTILTHDNYTDKEDGGDWCEGIRLPIGLKSLHVKHPEEFRTTGSSVAPCVNLKYLRVRVDGGGPNDLPLTTFQYLFLPSHNTLTSICLAYLTSDDVAEELLEVFAGTPFPNVRHLTLDSSNPSNTWRNLFESFPSLDSLEVAETVFGGPTQKKSVVAVGASVALTLRTLTFTSDGMAEDARDELLVLIQLSNLGGLRRLEIPMVSKDELAGETGLALLDECEERAISLVCRYGYLTRDMMKE